MKSCFPSSLLLAALGLASLPPYLAARGLIDLRVNTAGYVVTFLGAIVLYWAAVALILRGPAGHAERSGGHASRQGIPLTGLYPFSGQKQTGRVT